MTQAAVDLYLQNNTMIDPTIRVEELPDEQHYFNTTLGNYQAVDFIVSPSSNLSFLSDENFDQLVATKRVMGEAIDWCDLPINTVYCVQTFVPIQAKWGARVILELKNREGGELKVWAPTNICRGLKSGLKLNGVKVAYIKSLGQKETTTITGAKKRYYDFETVFI